MYKLFIDLLKDIEKRRKNGSFFLTSEAREAIYRLKKQFLRASLLRYFDLSLRIIIEINSSERALRGILSQLFEGSSEAK